MVPIAIGNILLSAGVITNMAQKQSSDWILRAISAPLAGMFLLLCLCLATFRPTPSSGVRLILPREPTSTYCGDSRAEVIHWGDDGSIWLNEEKVGAVDAPGRVAQVMQDRAERVLFLIPGESASVQEVADLATRLNASVDDLHIGLFTNRQVKSMTRTDHGMTWVPIGCMAWPQTALTKR